ncbi:iron ABC transporter permease [Natronosporangium hydrolyticum]|uniref:Iron ABC transporter permease n=1 Tax=Natronosporangium hydrolyticum TaxID=2811111 RepID=A0A895YML4_9ACTN|nr:iron ABC transporter permease [Natronosporangium hydrolyticum]QSB15340.1 iron ABC transporter permease [Natronosporangium hydrolyticum]
MRPTRRRPSGTGTGSAVGALAALGVLVAAPLAMLLWRAVAGHQGSPGALDALAEPENIRTVANTVLLGVLVIAVATVFAGPLAFLMAWTSLRRHRWLDVVVMLPFMTPPYVSALAWMDFTRPRGTAEQWLGPLGAAMQAVFATPLGMAIVMASEVYPFLYLLLRNNLARLGASMDEAAAVHGASRWQRGTRILLPLLAGGYSIGALVVFVRAAGEFGTPVTLGNQIGFHVLVSRIYQDITIDPLDFPRAAALSSVLLGLGMTVWGLQQWFLLRRQDRVATVRANRPAMVRLGRWAAPAAWLYIGAVLAVTVVIPYYAVISGSLSRLRSRPAGPGNLTLEHYTQVLSPGSGGWQALLTSAQLAFTAAGLTTVLGTVLALLALRRRQRLRGTVDFLALAPETVPTIVLALGFIFLWNAPWLPVTPYRTDLMLIVAYTAIFLPLVVQNVKSVRLQVSDRLLEAAAVAGASPWRTTRRVLLPLLLPGIVAGWLLAFVVGVRELVMSSLLRPPGTELLSPWILSQFEQGRRAEAMAMTVVGVFTTTVVMVLVDQWRSRLNRPGRPADRRVPG